MSATLDERTKNQGVTLGRIEQSQNRVLLAATVAAFSGLGTIIIFVITHQWH